MEGFGASLDPTPSLFSSESWESYQLCEVSVWLQLIQIGLQWLELRTGVWDQCLNLLCWSGFGVCELALQWLELRVGVCDPSIFLFGMVLVFVSWPCRGWS